jgi:nucleoid-associated protein YgaU
MRYLKRAVELDPNRPEYHLYVAWAANDASPAQLALAQALEIAGDLGRAHRPRTGRRFAVNYPLQAMMQLGVIPPVTFPADSRYYGFGVRQYTAPGGQVIPYLARRIVPQPGAPNYATINQYTVRQGDRLDLIAAKYLGDPLMAWLIADSNGAMRPEDLVATPGRVLAITAPQGIPGGPSAA